jgi:uncharacterized membrane protein
MTSKTRLFGHAIHPMLVHVPLGLFVIAAVFDAIYMAGRSADLTIASFWNVVAGVIAALIAAFFGMLDLLTIPRATRAFRIGVVHGVGNVTMTGLFAISAGLRWSAPAYRPSVFSLGLEFVGLGIGLVMGWLGAELVERLGVSVDDSAHLDAPSSLREGHQPASVRGRVH